MVVDAEIRTTTLGLDAQLAMPIRHLEEDREEHRDEHVTASASQPEFINRIDNQIITACQSGDADAFAQLFESCKDRVYSIALRFSGDDAVARDIAQDVFVKLFAQIKTFRGEAQFESWLYRMVVNACLDERRRRKRWLPMLVEDIAGALPFGRPHPAAESALDHLMHDEMQAQVQNIVAKLPADLRIVIVLRYTEGLSYDAIAEILRCPPGTVASRLNRAHRLLARRLERPPNHLMERSTENSTQKSKGRNNV